MRTRTALAAIALSAALLAGCSGASSGGSAAAATPAALVADRCVRCHDLGRIKSATHDAAGWTATIARMRQNGAQLSDAEAKQVVDFLSGGGASSL